MKRHKPASFKEARQAAGLSQFQVAAAVGVTPPAVSLWEAGQRRPSGPAKRLLADVLAVDEETIDSWFPAEPVTARAAAGGR
jgi:DNA-binding transcriptional regulator YiaG